MNPSLLRTRYVGFAWIDRCAIQRRRLQNVDKRLYISHPMLSESSLLIAEALESHQANPIYETGWDTCLPPAIYAHPPILKEEVIV